MDNPKEPDKNKIPKDLKSIQDGIAEFNDGFLDNLESIAASLEVLTEIAEKWAIKNELFPIDHFNRSDEPGQS